MKKIGLLIIDPQVDFCAAPGTDVSVYPSGTLKMPQGGSLYVEGADKDMQRLGDFLSRNRHVINGVHVTLDSHQRVHVAHQRFWINGEGQPPPLFSVITREDVEKGVWRASQPTLQDRALAYVTALENNKRYNLMIWPEHCLVGSLGTAVHPYLYGALMEWEDQFRRVDFVTKGNNPFTEHYSAVIADVEDPTDPTTQLNTRLISKIETYDEVIISGEASTHCVANTVRDIASNFSDPGAVKKFVYLRDTCSPVPVVKQLEEEFIKDMVAQGMRVSTTKEYMAGTRRSAGV